MLKSAGVTRLSRCLARIVACGIVLAGSGCGDPGPRAGSGSDAEPASTPDLPDDPPAAAECAGWQRSLAEGDWEKSRDTLSCLRELEQRDRAQAVREARTLRGWTLAEADLRDAVAALDRFPQAGELEQKLESLGLLSSPHEFDEDRSKPEPPPLSARDHLLRRGRTLWFDAETGTYPNQHDSLLAELAALAPAPLDEAAFEEVAPPYPNEAEAPYVLRASVGTRRYETEAEDHGDWYDVAAVLGLLNRIAADLGLETRFVTLPTGDQTALVLAAPLEALRYLQEQELVALEGSGVAEERGRDFEAEVVEELERRP